MGMTGVSALDCCPQCGGQGPWTATAGTTELRCENCGATVCLRPALVVTDQMVEVACRAEWDHGARDAPAEYQMSWDEIPEQTQYEWRAGVRVGLEAVAAMVAEQEVSAS